MKEIQDLFSVVLRSYFSPCIGYVQGGQEAKCGYLLLGIYYRRIPGDIEGNWRRQQYSNLFRR